MSNTSRLRPEAKMLDSLTVCECVWSLDLHKIKGVVTQSSIQRKHKAPYGDEHTALLS